MALSDLTRDSVLQAMMEYDELAPTNSSPDTGMPLHGFTAWLKTVANMIPKQLRALHTLGHGNFPGGQQTVATVLDQVEVYGSSDRSAGRRFA